MLVWRGHRAKVRSLAFSPDGSRIATTAGQSRFVWLWESHTGKKVEKLTDPGRYDFDSARCVCFFPDGQFVASTWERGGVTVWYTASGARAAVLDRDGHGQYADALAVSPDGARVFGCWNRELLEWVDPTATPPSKGQHPLTRAHARQCRGTPRIGFSPTGKYFCIAEWHLHLLDGTTLEPRLTLTAPTGNASAAAFAFTPDESKLAVALGHGAAVWNMADRGAPAVRITGHGNLVRAIGFLPGGGTVVTAAMDGTVRLWDAATGAEQRSFDWGIGKVQAAAVSPDGTLCAAGGDDGHLVVWDVDS